MNYCFLDLETTGFDAEKDSIIEISFIVCDENFTEIDRYDEVIVPSRSPLSSFVTKITGITQQEIDSSGKHWEQIRHIAEEKIGDGIIVGHNIDFDIRFLIGHGIDVSKNERIDTHELARILLPCEESFALEILSEKYKFLHTDAHRAMSDVEASIDLYKLLQDKIKNLPVQFLEQIKDFFDNKTHWFAKQLFEASSGSDESPARETSSSEISAPEAPESLNDHWKDLSENHSLFVREGDSLKAADFLKACAQKSEKSLIISPKLSFFSDIRQVPIPEVLFDTKRLQFFLQKRETLNNAETTFYLKCAYRSFLGYRGKDHFDLFFQERDLWREVCLESADHEVFQEILRECAQEKTLAISPAAFLQFMDLELFEDRVLLIDEAEIFAEKLLFAPAQNVSMGDYLHADDEAISAKTQFFIGNFCKEIIEPQLNHGMTPFPERLRLPRRASYSGFAESLRELSDDGMLHALADKLVSPDEKDVRWVVYYPETGNLNFGWWHPEAWRDTKAKLSRWKKIFLHRHHPSGSNAFFRVFTGCVEGSFLVFDDFFPKRTWEIPDNLPSVKAPEFNSFTAQKAEEVFRETEGWVGVNFSSLESLKKVFTQLSEDLTDEKELTLIGEKISGGDGKVLEKIKNASRVLLCHQKLKNKKIAEKPFEVLLIQKFPFNPPHPLLEEVEEAMKQSNQSFWELWVETQVGANLSRTLSVFPKVERIIFLDSRHNSGWGKNVLRGL